MKITSAGPLLAAALAAAVLAGCGSDDDYTNEARPPSTVVLTASIGPQRISISPARIGAGPVNLIITNQSGTPQTVTFTSAEGGAGSFEQETPPINPSDTATLRVDLPEGSAVLKTNSSRVADAQLDVGPERESAQNKLLLP